MASSSLHAAVAVVFCPASSALAAPPIEPAQQPTGRRPGPPAAQAAGGDALRRVCGDPCKARLDLANGIKACPKCSKAWCNVLHAACRACARQQVICEVCGKAMPAATRPVVMPATQPGVAWGPARDGLQLGIAPLDAKEGPARPVFDGQTIRFRAMLRNSGAMPVRLLASVHTCLLGEGGSNSLLVSKVVIRPKHGGDVFTADYRA